MNLDVEMTPHFARAVELARQAGNDSLATTIARLGEQHAAAETLSFDDEEAAREAVDALRAAPLLGDLHVALVASALMELLGDTESAGHCLIGLFRARREAGNADFMASDDLMAQLARCAVAYNEHEGPLAWAFETLSPSRRARWAALMAAAVDNVGMEDTAGWGALLRSSVGAGGEVRPLVEEACRAVGTPSRVESILACALR